MVASILTSRLAALAKAAAKTLREVIHYPTPEAFTPPDMLGKDQQRSVYIQHRDGVAVRTDTASLAIVRHMKGGSRVPGLATLEPQHSGETLPIPRAVIEDGMALGDVVGTQPLTLVTHAEGTALVVQMGDGRAVLPVTELPDLPTVETGVYLKHGPIPQALLEQFFAVARDTHKEHGTEVMGWIMWNRQEASYQMIIPRQTVSATLCTPFHRPTALDERFTPEVDDPNFDQVMTLHSHHTMGAFESSVDAGVLHKAIDNGLSVIVGRIDRKEPEVNEYHVIDGKARLLNGQSLFAAVEAKELPVWPADWLDSRVEVSTSYGANTYLGAGEGSMFGKREAQWGYSSAPRKGKTPAKGQMRLPFDQPIADIPGIDDAIAHCENQDEVMALNAFRHLMKELNLTVEDCAGIMAYFWQQDRDLMLDMEAVCVSQD